MRTCFATVQPYSNLICHTHSFAGANTRHPDLAGGILGGSNVSGHQGRTVVCYWWSISGAGVSDPSASLRFDRDDESVSLTVLSRVASSRQFNVIATHSTTLRAGSRTPRNDKGAQYRHPDLAGGILGASDVTGDQGWTVVCCWWSIGGAGVSDHSASLRFDQDDEGVRLIVQSRVASSCRST